jgi:hypothetical protein
MLNERNTNFTINRPFSHRDAGQMKGFYVWVAWKGEDGEREDVHVRLGNEARCTEFPEFDHLLAEL